MTQLAILTAAERRRFDQPPVLNNDERRLHFNVTSDVRLALARIEQPTNKAGFLLQLGYFRASARFYSTTSFRRRDVDYVRRLLKLESVDLTDYTHIVPQRHRRTIRSLLNWHAVDDAAHEELSVHARRYVANQEYPKRIFYGLIDLCWKRQWIIPAYHELNEIITRSFNAADRQLLAAVERALRPNDVERLEALLLPIQRGPTAGSMAPLTMLKRIDQSLKTGAIKSSLEILVLFREHFLALAPALDALPLSDRATDYYATWLAKADHQQLSQFPNRYKAYLHLLAFVKHQFYQRQDHAIDVLLKSVSAARQSVKQQLNQRDQAKKPERNLAIQALRQAHLKASEFANGVVAITRAADATASEKYYKIETLVNDYLAGGDTDMVRIEALDADIASELKNVSYYELLASRSAKLQRRVADVVRTVTFDTATSGTDLIAAIDHFKATDGRLGAHPPSEFLTKQEHEAVYRDGVSATPLYKCLLFFHMAHAIKSGHLNLRYSYRYRAIQDYLISPAEWKVNKATILKETGLAEYADGERTLAALKDVLDERYRTVNDNFLAGRNPYMSVNDDDGRCRVRTPSTDYESRSFIASTLTQQGIVPILQLLKAVDRVCDYTGAFKHFSTKHSKMKPTHEALTAGILAKGCNIGLGKLAKISTGLDIDVLRNTVNWYFDQDNLRAANRKITELISELALANNYLHRPPTIHSSSDGRKMNVAVDCLHANYSFKYFGKDKGVTDYTFIDERHALFHSQVFSASDREAPYVIDGLLDNQVPDGRIHSTDTHGFTEQVFCATHLLGIAFAPRLANLGKHRLYGFSSRKTYQKMGYALLPSRTINQKLILRLWDDVLRFMATIKTRHTTASQLFKRLSSYALDHPLYQALKEFGRIIKSQFILTYYDDVELRQQIQKQLSRIEQANKFSAAVFFDNDEAFQDGSLHQQEAATACKLLLQNAIILWNYLSLSERIIDTSEADECRQIIDAIRRGSVITWSHVNLHGEYTFTPTSANDAVFDIERIKALTIN